MRMQLNFPPRVIERTGFFAVHVRRRRRRDGTPRPKRLIAIRSVNRSIGPHCFTCATAGRCSTNAVKYFDHLPLHPWILAPAWRRKVWTVRIRSSRQEYIQSLDGRLQQPLAGSVLRGPRESCAAKDLKPQILAQIRSEE